MDNNKPIFLTPRTKLMNWKINFLFFPLYDLSKQAVLKIIYGLNGNKSTGPDNIPGKLKKICAFKLHKVFPILFWKLSRSWRHSWPLEVGPYVPSVQKVDKSSLKTYRPFYLTSISCKFLELIVHSNIMDFLDQLDFLIPFQHGFRPKRSCESQLFSTLRHFSSRVSSSGQIDTVSIDFSEAFEKVNLKRLPSKIRNTGIHSPLSTGFPTSF